VSLIAYEPCYMLFGDKIEDVAVTPWRRQVLHNTSPPLLQLQHADRPQTPAQTKPEAETKKTKTKKKS